MNIGFNFFGASKCMGDDFAADLAALKGIGFTCAEPLLAFSSSVQARSMADIPKPPANDPVMKQVWVDGAAAERIEATRAAGLQVVSAHVFGALAGTEDELRDLAQNHGIKYFVTSFPGACWDGLDGYIDEVSRAAAALEGTGAALAYHNHETECVPRDGVSMLDEIMARCPGVMLELDVGWADFGGVDPVALMQKYADRLPLLHLKDITADAGPHNRDKSFAAIGAGRIPLAAIMAEAKKLPRLEPYGVIIDQDNSTGSIFEDFKTGIANIRAAGWA